MSFSRVKPLRPRLLRLFADCLRGELFSGRDLPHMPLLGNGGRFQYHDERLPASARYDKQDRLPHVATDFR